MFTVPCMQDLDGLRHAFFSREGGVSEGLYASLNCGTGSGDRPSAVRDNRARAMAALGLPADALVTNYQIHSADAVIVETAGGGGPARADGLATRQPGVALGVLTADCAPVLMADAEAGVIGAAHAGWRGALNGVIEATLAAMSELGAARERTVAAVGPAIGPDSYEVGAEFLAAFVEEDEANRRFFSPSDREGHHMFDLPGYVGVRLGSLGLKAVDVLGLDTCADERHFFSYRRATWRGEPDYGRILSAIALVP